MGVFQLIDGKVTSMLTGWNGTIRKLLRTDDDGVLLIKNKPVSPGGYAFFDDTYPVGTNTPFLFTGIRKDVHLETDKPITIRLNSLSSTPVTVDRGVWEWTDEYISGMYITFTESTKLGIWAGG